MRDRFARALVSAGLRLASVDGRFRMMKTIADEWRALMRATMAQVRERERARYELRR